MKKHIINTARLFSAIALFAACGGVESYEDTEQTEETEATEEISDILSYDETGTPLEETEVASAEDNTIDKVRGRDGCPNDMTLAASRLEGNPQATPLYCRLRECVPMGTHAIKYVTFCFPVLGCQSSVGWEYIATNRPASSTLCPEAIQDEFGL